MKQLHYLMDDKKNNIKTVYSCPVEQSKTESTQAEGIREKMATASK